MKTLNLAVISALLVSSVAIAGPDHHGHKMKMKKPDFAELDKNQDGDVSFDEFSAYAETQAHYKKMFERKDKNSDGVITPDEFKAKHGRTSFADIDANDDGEITEAEVKAHLDGKDLQRKFFDKMDSDSNGVISQQEHSEFKPMKKRRKYMKKHLFKKLDTDGNGEITRAEAQAVIEKESRQLKIFEHFDTNQDGVITKKEMKQAKRKKGES